MCITVMLATYPKDQGLSCKYLQRNGYKESNKVDFIQYFHSPMDGTDCFFIFMICSIMFLNSTKNFSIGDKSRSNYSLKPKNFK